MAEHFEVLPFGGKKEESELERQLARGGMGRGGAARGGIRLPARPMARAVGRSLGGAIGHHGSRPLQGPAHGPHGTHRPRLHHGPRHGLRYPYGWPYWAPAYWGWSYPAGAAINVFDDGGAQDGAQDNASDSTPDAASDGVQGGSPGDAGYAPVQGEALRPHRAGCRCAGCSGTTFDVLPFTVTQLAALEGRNNWRSRRW
jgi:hypothetical protein